MSIDEAVKSLAEKLGDDEVFIIRHDGHTISVTVSYVYRTPDVTNLGPTWEGYPLRLGRISCW